MREFIIYGQPVAKGRPRLGKWGTYTPQKTVEYENLIRLSYLEKYKGESLIEDQIKLNISFYFPVPKSVSQKKRQAMLEGKIMHDKRPDIDNCIKSITDALNGLAYKDDNQIVEVHAMKLYDETPRTVVKISTLTKEGENGRKTIN